MKSSDSLFIITHRAIPIHTWVFLGGGGYFALFLLQCWGLKPRALLTPRYIPNPNTPFLTYQLYHYFAKML
jgi:hypothetical protein